MHRFKFALSILAALAFSWLLPSWTDPAAAGPDPSVAKADAPAPVAVLELSHGSFRGFMAWRTPTTVSADGRIGPAREPQRTGVEDKDRKVIPVRHSAPPPADWAATAFDDSEWARIEDEAAVNMAGDEWRIVCIRGGFIVTDPAAVGELKLNVGYYGGARVLVNGVEIARADLPDGELTLESLATPYPKEAYLRPDGKLYGRRDGIDPKLRQRIVTARVRTFGGDAGGVTVPARLLRKGLNVVAVESHAAPVSELIDEAPTTDQNYREAWAHVGLASVRLTAASPAGLVPNAGPTPEVQIGNVAPADTLAVWDYALPCEKLAPVRLIGARNGYFTGRVILSSSRTLTGLKATPGELLAADGKAKIAASAVQVRWAKATDAADTWARPNRFDPLSDAPPKEVAPLAIDSRAAPKGLTPSALAPVWITVHVPADAAPGDYAGNVVVEADGKAFDVPVALSVADWKTPDPADFTVVNAIWQSPDSVAAWYKVKPFSDEHLRLIGRSFDALHQVGNKLCVVPLVAHAKGWGNKEGMVRWIKKAPSTGSGQADGGYDYDFSYAEKYMDAYQKACGKPAFLLLVAWEFPGDNPAKPKWPQASVTVLDKDGNQLEDMLQPPYGTPENEAFWKPVFAGLHERLQKRGWLDCTYISWLTYCNAPDKELVGVVKRIWPDGKWMKTSHRPDTKFFDMPVPVNVWVWGAGALYDPDYQLPWASRPVYYPEGRKDYPQPWLPGRPFVSMGDPRWCVPFLKSGLYGQSSLMRYRMVAEAATQGDLRGVGSVGGDFWPVPDSRGRMRTYATGEGAVTPTANLLSLTSPGPDGAVLGCRAEMFREGIQVAEAVISLRKALADKKVSGELADRIRLFLDERARQQLRNNSPIGVSPGGDGSYWLTGQCLGDWRAREAELFALAAQAAAR
ncbi:MAG: hypothetical protein BIFFINMI_01086 [Phycisphaerae bacterium]|nr:hypothetical protein [Phycisphaerae bacterium]